MPHASTTTADHDAALAHSRALRRDRQRRYRASLRAAQECRQVAHLRSLAAPPFPFCPCIGFVTSSSSATPGPATTFFPLGTPSFFGVPPFPPPSTGFYNYGAPSIAPNYGAPSIAPSFGPTIPHVGAAPERTAPTALPPRQEDGAPPFPSAPPSPTAPSVRAHAASSEDSAHGLTATSLPHSTPGAAAAPDTSIHPEQSMHAGIGCAASQPQSSSATLVVREFGSLTSYKPFYSRVRQRCDKHRGGTSEPTQIEPCLGTKILSSATSSIFLLVGFIEGEAVAVCGATLIHSDIKQQRTCDIEVFLVDPSSDNLGVHNALLTAALQRSSSAKIRLGRGITQRNRDVHRWREYGFPLDGQRKLLKGATCATTDVANWCATVAERFPLRLELELLPPSAAVPQRVLTPLDLTALGLRNRVRVFKSASPGGACRSLVARMLGLCAAENFRMIEDIHQYDDVHRSIQPLPPGWDDMTCDDLKEMRNHILHDKTDVVRRGSMIRSLPGGSIQSWHLDFSPECVTSELEAGRRAPYTVLLSLSPNGVLYIQGDHGEVMRVSLDRGDLVRFSGDVRHAGSAYDAVHFRVHWFVHSAHPHGCSSNVLPHEAQIYYAKAIDASGNLVSAVTHSYELK